MSFTNEIEKAVVEWLTIDQDKIKLDKALLPILATVVNDTKSLAFAFQLRTLGVITRNEEEECDAIKTSFQKNNYLYNIVSKKPGSGKLIKALLETGNEHIVTLVAESYWKLNPDKFPVTDLSQSSTIKTSSSSLNPPPAATQIGGPGPGPGSTLPTGLASAPQLLPVSNSALLKGRLSGIELEGFLRPIIRKIYDSTLSGPFMDALYEKGVITMGQKELCARMGNNAGRNDFLYKIVFMKNSVAKCIDALDNPDNDHILEKMVHQLST